MSPLHHSRSRAALVDRLRNCGILRFPEDTLHKSAACWRWSDMEHLVDWKESSGPVLHIREDLVEWSCTRGSQ